MSNCPGNDGKIMSQGNFKISSCERPEDELRVSLIEFGVMWEVCLPGGVMWLWKQAIPKRGMPVAATRFELTTTYVVKEHSAI